MFIHADNINTSIWILIIVFAGVPLLLRIIAGFLSTAIWGPRGIFDYDPAPAIVKVFKGLLVISVMAMPVMLWGPVSEAVEKQIVVVEGIDDERLEVTRSYYMEKEAVFGLVGFLGALLQASDTPPGRLGPVGVTADLPEDLAETIERSGARDFLINLAERPLTHWRIGYAAEGNMPVPPLRKVIAHGDTYSSLSKRLHAGCMDLPPRTIQVEGDREVTVRRRTVTIEGERFPSVSWLSWPGQEECVREALGLPAP